MYWLKTSLELVGGEAAIDVYGLPGDVFGSGEKYGQVPHIFRGLRNSLRDQ